MNRPVYLTLSMPELSKILMYKFWYDYVQKKAQNIVIKICHKFEIVHVAYF